MARPVRRPGVESNPVDQTTEALSNSWQFILEYQWWILAIVTLFILGWWFRHHFMKQEHNLKKIWIFILFFLTKRQMMIPLVVTLAKKDGFLDDEIRSQLLEIRDKCREVSLKKQPQQRLLLEQDVSKVLFYYFTQLEREDKIIGGTKFEKIVRDLEFIDAKLVQLQQVYNQETQTWNKKIKMPGLGWLLKIFRFKRFEGFSVE